MEHALFENPWKIQSFWAKRAMSLFRWAEELSPADSVGFVGVHISNGKVRDFIIAEKKINSAILKSSALKPSSFRTRMNLQSARALSFCSSQAYSKYIGRNLEIWKKSRKKFS